MSSEPTVKSTSTVACTCVKHQAATCTICKLLRCLLKGTCYYDSLSVLLNINSLLIYLAVIHSPPASLYKSWYNFCILGPVGLPINGKQKTSDEPRMRHNDNDLLFSIVKQGLQEGLCPLHLVLLLLSLVLLPEQVIVTQHAKVCLVLSENCTHGLKEVLGLNPMVLKPPNSVVPIC